MINAAPQTRKDKPLLAHAALLLMAAIWGINFSVSKTALRNIPPLAFNALRFPMAALLIFVVLRRKGPIPLPKKTDLPRVLALGLLGNFVYQLCFILGLNLTTPANASLLLAATPVVTALLSALFGHERVAPRVWVGVAATFVGIVLIVTGSVKSAGPEHVGLLGYMFLFGAVVTWAFYTVGGRAIVQARGPLVVTAWTLWVGTAALVAAGAPELLAMQWQVLTIGNWLALLYSGVLSIGFCYMIYYYGVSRLGATRTASYSNFVPVFALLSAWLWLGQTPTWPQLTGAVIIIGGITLAQSGASRAPLVSPEI